MLKYFLFSVIVSLSALTEAVRDTPDSSVPTRYTITHEATLDIVVKEHAKAEQPLSQGRVVIGLFGDIVPMTVLNFVTITNGITRGNVRQILTKVSAIMILYLAKFYLQ